MMDLTHETAEIYDPMDQLLFPPSANLDLATLDQEYTAIWIAQQLFYHGNRTKEEAIEIAGQWSEDGETLKTATITRLMASLGNQHCFCIDECRALTRGVEIREPWEHLRILPARGSDGVTLRVLNYH